MNDVKAREMKSPTDSYKEGLNAKLDVSFDIKMSEDLLTDLKDPARLLSFILGSAFRNNDRLIISAKVSKIEGDKYIIVSELP